MSKKQNKNQKKYQNLRTPYQLKLVWNKNYLHSLYSHINYRDEQNNNNLYAMQYNNTTNYKITLQ